MTGIRFGRIAAAATHFIICLVIAAVVMAIFWGVWYPNGLTDVADATDLLLIILGVDIVVGPLLTLVLFVPGKKGLFFDLVFIAVLQVAALAYGVHAMLQTRPIFLVALSDRLQLVSANEIDDVQLALAPSPDFGYRSYTGPVLVGSRDPEDPQRFASLTGEILMGGPEIDRRPEFYVPFAPMATSLAARAKNLSSWSPFDEEGPKLAFTWAKARGLLPESVAVVPIDGRGGRFAMLMTVDSGELLRVFPFDPGPVVLSPTPEDVAPSPEAEATPDKRGPEVN